MLVDVTVRLHPALPHWPGQVGFSRVVQSSVDQGDTATVSTLSMGAHTGTHMDAPSHFLAAGSGIETLDLEACVGPGFVADLRAVRGAISAEDLESAGIPDGVTRLVALTRNSGWSRSTTFAEDFCAYDASAADWCVQRGIRLVGNDYLSIEPFGSGATGHPTHKRLLEAGVVILEGIDLDGVDPGVWEVIALPIPVVSGDGAPARVVLRR